MLRTKINMEINNLTFWVISIVVLLILFVPTFFKEKKHYTLDPGKLVSATYENQVMTITYSNGSKIRYLGNINVWHEMPLMKRCSTSTEKSLCEIWTYIDHFGNPYPNRHEEL